MATERRQLQPDRRVRRSRRAMRDAYISLVLESGYEHVTVEAVTERADVARATFYAHYADLHDLLVCIARDLADELVGEALPAAQAGPELAGRGTVTIFRHADEHRDAYRLVVSNSCPGEARAVFASAITDGVATHFAHVTDVLGITARLPIELVARTFTAGLLAALEWWIVERGELPAGQMAGDAHELLLNGSVWGLAAEDLVAVRRPEEDSA